MHVHVRAHAYRQNHNDTNSSSPATPGTRVCLIPCRASRLPDFVCWVRNRHVGVTYSKPPGRCASEMGSFTVNYTLNTGWTHPAVQYIVRHVSDCVL